MKLFWDGSLAKSIQPKTHILTVTVSFENTRLLGTFFAYTPYLFGTNFPDFFLLRKLGFLTH